MNFRLAADELAKSADLMGSPTMTTGWPSDRPVAHQPEVQTDGMDPATPGGPAPMNGDGSGGDPVATDPLLPVPAKDPHGKMPHIKGPDVDTTVLKNFRQHGDNGWATR